MSDRVRTGLAGADPDCFLDIEDEYLAVADASRARSLLNRIDRGFDAHIVDHDLDFHFGQEIDDIFCATIEFGVAFLAAETLGLSDGDTLHADFLQGLLHLVQLEWLNDRLDLLHSNLPGDMTGPPCMILQDSCRFLSGLSTANSNTYWPFCAANQIALHNKQAACPFAVQVSVAMTQHLA